MKTKEDVINGLTIDGKLISKRCTIPYLEKIGLYDTVISLSPPQIESINNKIQHIIYGGGICLHCDNPTKRNSVGVGFEPYCDEHKVHGNKGREAHNKFHIPEEVLNDLYINQNKTASDIARTYDTSPVTILKYVTQYGIGKRSHSENQKINSPNRGKTCPRIKIDRSELVYLYRDKKTPVRILAKKYNCHDETIRRFLIQEGVERTHRRSYIEHMIAEILSRNNIAYIPGRRVYIPPLEIDFYLPKYNIGIELHGMYTHSYYSGKMEKGYHNLKYRLAKEKDIRLFQFWEDDLCKRLPVIESMIRNACYLNEKQIGARKCEVRNIDFTTLADFCEQNHIQGKPGNNSKGIGLFYKDDLVSVIAHKKNIITRFCSVKDTNVPGGFTKLMKHIPYDELITYSSNDISEGRLYEKSGFQLVKENGPDLWYTDYKKIYNRQKFMKKNLKDSPYYCDSKTELQIMLEDGYDAIYKSGTKTWKLIR